VSGVLQEEILGWEMKLAWLQEGLGLLNQVQRKWLYLQPIFARGALPQQQPRFRSVDDDFRRLMQHLEVGHTCRLHPLHPLTSAPVTGEARMSLRQC
jgi:hypothetical protein